MVVSVALSVLFPVLLLPLFMKSEPLSDGPMADELWATVRSSGVPVKEMRLLHMGEKTSAANAMVAGLGPTLRVYVGDTIAEGEDAEEGLTDTRLVLAHELGHHAHGDVWRLLGITALTLAAGMAGAWLGVRELSPDGPGHLTSLPSLAVIALANQKGGVAKTTTTLNLGVAFAEQGNRVLASTSTRRAT
jgi:STE24 endopeptidase